MTHDPTRPMSIRFSTAPRTTHAARTAPFTIAAESKLPQRGAQRVEDRLVRCGLDRVDFVLQDQAGERRERVGRVPARARQELG